MMPVMEWSQLVRWWRPIVAATLGFALFGAAALASTERDDTIASRLEAAAARAETGVGAVLTGELTADEVVEPLDAADFRELYVVLRAEVLTDPEVARVRIWGRDGTIVFSTGDRAEIGTVPAADAPIAAVMSGASVSRDVTEPFTASTAGLDPSPLRMWQTWLPLVTGDRTQPQGVVQVDHDRAVVVAGAGASAARLASTLQVLAIVALILAAALAVTTALALEPGDDLARGAGGPSVDVSSDEETAMALAEVAHERDVSMARASDAEERARLAGERLASLAPLERRVEVAERRALDAERRLDEIDERVGAATIGDAQAPIGDSEVSNGESPAEEPTAPAPGNAGEPSAAARQAAELRARLARTAARKKPGSNR
jgi:predicted outer membrane lipoprotein